MVNSRISTAGGNLTVKAIEAIDQPGHYRAGDGLYLLWRSPTARSWVYRYTFGTRISTGAATAGKVVQRTREMGLGPYDPDRPERHVSLNAARAKVLKLQEQRNKRDDETGARLFPDPIAAMRAKREAAMREKAHTIALNTKFKEFADRYVDNKIAGTLAPVSVAQWRRELANHVYPVIGDFAIHAVTTAHVLDVMRPLWRDYATTAVRVRGKIETILDAAAFDMRDVWPKDWHNPARWKGHLKNAVEAPTHPKQVKHFAAMPYADVPAFMARLREDRTMSAIALEFTIITCVRVGEATEATWGEFDLNERMWTIPAARMKQRGKTEARDHRVPLSDRAMQILRDLGPGAPDAPVFPRRSRKRILPLNRLMPLRVLKKMGLGEITVHGFRSAFRDWAFDKTNYPHQLVEMHLSHYKGISDETVRAYLRSDGLERRRQLAADWTAFCMPPALPAPPLALPAPA